MGNSVDRGMLITPLVLSVFAVLCAVIGWIGVTGLLKQDKMFDEIALTNQRLATIITSQGYDRREIDSIRGEVKDVRVEVRALSERVGKVESRR